MVVLSKYIRVFLLLCSGVLVGAGYFELTGEMGAVLEDAIWVQRAILVQTFTVSSSKSSSFYILRSSDANLEPSSNTKQILCSNLLARSC